MRFILVFVYFKCLFLPKKEFKNTDSPVTSDFFPEKETVYKKPENPTVQF